MISARQGCSIKKDLGQGPSTPEPFPYQTRASLQSPWSREEIPFARKEAGCRGNTVKRGQCIREVGMDKRELRP